jgi:uncharacterized Tic20 family protein
MDCAWSDERKNSGMATGATDGATLVGIPLRNGGALSVWTDRLETAGVTFPLAEIEWAGLVNDPAAPAGAAPLPAVAWRMKDGQQTAVTPADPPHAWQILETLYRLRPDLRSQLPPPAPSAARPGAWAPPPPYGYAAPRYMPSAPYAPPQSNNNETVMAGIAHLSIFFGAPIVALIFWLVNRTSVPYAAQHAKQAFFFQLAVVIAEIIVILAYIAVFFAGMASMFGSVSSTNPQQPPPQFFALYGGLLVFYVVLFAIHIVAIVFSVIGAVKAFQGKSYHYPLLGRI